MMWHVILQRRAGDDVQNTLDWIASRSPSGAVKWLDAFEAALELVGKNPEGYGLADEDEWIPDVTLRQFLFQTRKGRVFRRVFTVVGQDVRVFRIRSGEQSPLDEDDL